MDSSVDLDPQEKAIQRKSRRSFVMVCLAFIVPIVLAKMALDQHWFNYGVTNQGQLIEQELHLSDLGLAHLHDEMNQTQKPWLLVYNLPEHCQSECVQLFNGLSNTYVALGKDMKRVQLVALAPAQFTSNANRTKNDNNADTSRWTLVPQNSDMVVPSTLTRVFIVDPLGNIVLMHQPPASVEQLPAFGKAIVADFKILLKLSRIG